MGKLLQEQFNELILQEDGGGILLDQEVHLTIAGVDKTRSIVLNSIKVENILTNKRDTLSFTIRNHTGDTYVPNMGAEVNLNDTENTLFGGVITSIESEAQAFGVIEHKIECQDFTRLLDHKLVPDTFQNQTVDQIITSLKNSYFPSGFTITNVNAPVEIKYIAFKYKPLAKCIEELAKAINYDWYVDYNKDLHFFAKESVSAPFSITDSNGNAYYDSLIIRQDNSQLRNSIIVRGGEYLGSQLTVDILTNGVDTHFPLPYRFADFGAHLTGEILSVGVDNLDQADDYDALYNFQEKIIKFKTADTPTTGKTLKVSGKPYLPVIVKYTDPVSVAATMSAEGGDGIYEYLIEDKSIASKEGARQRAQAEIYAYAQTLTEGEFMTEEDGLRAGMAINIQSTTRGINETFIINKVIFTQFSKDTWLYKVSLITTRTMDLIDVLQKLLLDSTKKIEIDPNEVSDIFFEFVDQADFTDTLGTFSSHSTTYRWSPSSEQGIWNFATWA